MFIPRRELEGLTKGSKVVLTKDVEVLKGLFTQGHEFTIEGEGPRGFDLIDANGEGLGECPSSHFRPVK